MTVPPASGSQAANETGARRPYSGSSRPTGTISASTPLRFELAYHPPLDWEALCCFFKHRAIDGVESVENNTYSRTLRLEHQMGTRKGWIAAAPSQTEPLLTLTISASLSQVVPSVLARAKQVFDLECDPMVIAAGLGELAAQHPGLRLPGAWEGFEVLTRAILGQQVTVQAARTFASRLASVFGEPLIDDPDDDPAEWPDRSTTPTVSVMPTGLPGGLARLFPTAERIAEIHPSDIQALGVVGARARSIVTVAEAVVSGGLRLQPGEDPATLSVSLRRLPGVGEWTAEYVMMRALSWPDAFLATDRGVLRAMQENDPRRALRRAEAWRPWRSYAVMYLWQTLVDQRTEKP